APPAARVGPLTPEERRAIVAASALGAKYDRTIDRESAYEILAGRKGLPSEPAQSAAEHSGSGGGGLMDMLDRLTDVLSGSGSGSGSTAGAPPPSGPAPAPAPKTGGGRQKMSVTELVIRSAAQSLARSAST